MLNFIKAENLKCKNTFAKKLVFIAPIFMIMLAYVSGKYFVECGFNWWYTIILPGYVTLLTVLVNQIEDNKLKYRTVYALPISLKKVWISKTLLIAFYVSISSVIHMLGMIFGKATCNTACTINLYQIIIATVILIITSLWQIPLCLFLSKKFGMVLTVLVNVIGGIALNLIMVTKSFWWACPYCYSTRLMCPTLGILPNGVMVEVGDVLLDSTVIPIGIALSVLLFVLILSVTTIWFPKQEVK